METLNNIVLIGIFFGALVNLVVELDEEKTTKYVVIAKLLFATMAIGAILAALNPQVGYFLILNTSIFLGLVIRIIRHFNRKFKK